MSKAFNGRVYAFVIVSVLFFFRKKKPLNIFLIEWGINQSKEGEKVVHVSFGCPQELVCHATLSLVTYSQCFWNPYRISAMLSAAEWARYACQHYSRRSSILKYRYSKVCPRYYRDILVSLPSPVCRPLKLSVGFLVPFSVQVLWFCGVESLRTYYYIESIYLRRFPMLFLFFFSTCRTVTTLPCFNVFISASRNS